MRLCRLDELPTGTSRGFDVEGVGEDTIFVLRHGDGLRAYRNRCPHMGVRLEYRKDRFLSLDGEHIVCYAHGAQFDPDTGTCTQGACLGKSLEPVSCSIVQGYVCIDD
jgi:nitrite reductase/ring-hydroxylating ferredoxin subunit